MSKINMNTGEVERVAGVVETCNNAIEKKLENVTSAITSMNNTWDGEAADAASGYYTGKIRPLLDSQKTLIKNFSNFMRQSVASGYEQTEQGNTKLADNFK